uniref:Cell growth regulator with ring finger domain 1 n=1 Tax=Nothobranchius kadleci TaxID=1051664 RepID=A0A1A8DI00_NOTKA
MDDAIFDLYVPVLLGTVISVTAAFMALTWFRFNLFDNPVIFSSSDQPTTQTPEKPMVQVTNPFALELGSGSACVADGVSVKLSCLQPCVLTCFWGCEVGALQGALQTQQRDPRLRSPHHLLDALQLHCCYCESFHVSSRDGEEHRTCVPAYLGVTDFGPLPRHHYPLVAVLTLAEPGDRDRYNIVASAAVIHVPDEKHNLSSRILFQYLLTSQGHTYELKPLFMSAVDGDTSGPELRREDNGRTGDGLEGTSSDCVVCQNAAINRVLLPCRHTCVCDTCVDHIQHCPICRAFVLESFVLDPAAAY